MRDCCIYIFNQQKIFGARYIIEDLYIIQEEGKYDENNLKYRGNATTKNWQEARLFITFLG